MKKNFIQALILMLFVCAQTAFTQEIQYSSLLIPKELKENANAVIRNSDVIIFIDAIDKMRVKEKRVVTVLNRLGNREVQTYLHYDNHSKVSKISAIIYDALGNKIKKFSKSKFEDVSAVDGGTLYSDSRVLYLAYTPVNYPYTVVLESEYQTSSTGFIRGWFPVEGYYVSVQKSSYKLINKANIKFRKNELNFKGFDIENTSIESELNYSILNQKAKKYEYNSINARTFLPQLKVSLDRFSLKGIHGYGANWHDFGKWMHDYLIQGRDQLDANTISEVKKLVIGIDDPIEKAKKVYQYMQNKTRYISVQVGVGGWEPIPAREVDNVGYGDCKGLTNYTKALLDLVGVESYYTILYAKDRRDIDKEFTSFSGNHAILNIPHNGKDIWLECTSQITPFGFLGDFTDDRDVLVVTPKGGIIKRTTAYKNEQNLQNSKAIVTIDSLGSVKANLEINSYGIQYDQKYQLETLNSKEQKKYYKASYWENINNLKINTIKLSNNKDSIVFNEKLNINISGYASLTSNEMLVSVNLFNKNNNVPKRYRNRLMPLKIERGFKDEDMSIIEIPNGYHIAALFDERNITNKFGHYKISIKKVDENHLKYTRTLLIKEGLYPKEDYKSYRAFRRKVAKSDNLRIALIKN